MKHRTLFNLCIALGLTLALGTLFISLPPIAKAQGPVGTTFTYQGRLVYSSQYLNGTCSFDFRLYDDPTAGAQIGSTLSKSNVTVSDGYFTVDLDFGDVFDGNKRYLDVSNVNCGNPGDPINLSGRVELNAAPYAAGVSWSGITTRPAGLDDGDNDTLASLACGFNQTIVSTGSGWVCNTGGVADHGLLTGLTDDDHPQYLLVDSTTRALISNLNAGSNKITNLAAATTNGDAVRYQQAVKVGDTAGGELAGTYPNPTIISTIARDSEITPTVLANDGSGSTLDADLLDGQDGSFYRSAGNINAGTLSTLRYSAYTDLGNEGYLNNDSGIDLLTRTQLDARFVNEGQAAGGDLSGTYPNPTIVDGSGSGLDADLLDGLNSTAFATAIHNHWGEIWNPGTGSTGLTLSGGTTGIAVTGSSEDILLGGGTIRRSGSGTEDILLDSPQDVFIVLDNNGGGLVAEFAVYNVSLATKVFKVEEDGDVFADGGYNCGNSISGTLAAGAISESDLEAGPCFTDDSAADFAEMLPATQAEVLEPGDVLVIGPDGELTRSSEAYQPTVVGIYSTRPSYLGNAQFAGVDGYAPLAVVGVVPVKVSAENGPIQPGDMLVASSTPGYAMRCQGVELCFGRTIGKALAPLDKEVGLIQVLVTLQ